jgi:hypothetical protein
MPVPVTAFRSWSILSQIEGKSRRRTSYFIPSCFINDLRVQLQDVIGHGTVSRERLGWHSFYRCTPDQPAADSINFILTPRLDGKANVMCSRNKRTADAGSHPPLSLSFLFLSLSHGLRSLGLLLLRYMLVCRLASPAKKSRWCQSLASHLQHQTITLWLGRL